MEWKTGKPNKHGRYLVTRTIFGKYTIIDIVDYGKMDDLEETKKVCWYDHDSDYGDYEVSNVIAWMELPEPFKKKEDSNETKPTINPLKLSKDSPYICTVTGDEYICMGGCGFKSGTQCMDDEDNQCRYRALPPECEEEPGADPP